MSIADLSKVLSKNSFVRVIGGSIEDFLSKVCDVEQPSEEQIKNFVEYVSGAHSWYKHWHPAENTTKLLIYPDHYAGFIFEKDEQNEVWHIRERIREKTKYGMFGCIHYSDVPTKEYHRIFGFLKYAEFSNELKIIPELNNFATPVTAVLHSSYPEFASSVYGEHNTFFHETRTIEELEKLRKQQLNNLFENTKKLLRYIKNRSH